MADQLIQLTKLRKDGGTQQRAKLDSAIVAEYAERMKAGDEFPPVDVFHDGEEYWLASGFHREAAAREAGKKAIRINLRKGTLRDAILFSCGANSSHGLRRSNADKRKSVTTLLEDAVWGKNSANWIAEHCCVSQEFVRMMKSEVTTVVTSDGKVTGKDGKKYPAQKTPKPRIETIEDTDDGTDTEDGTEVHETACEPEPVRPFANLPSLPHDVSDAFEAFKLCVLRHRIAGWQEISQGDLVATLESLVALAESEGGNG